MNAGEPAGLTGPREEELDPDVLEELEFWTGPDEDEGPPSAEEPDPVAPTGVTGEGSGALVLVGTPIGNLGDLSPRAEQSLREADVIYCEDTRHSRKLLTHAGISGRPLRSLHEHNEDQRTAEVLAAVGEGRTVALVSDAGMPGVSDPGSRVVEAAARAGLTVTVIPGPSAVLAALVTSGLATDRFCFEGFLPRSGKDRRERLRVLAGEPRTTVLFEAPGRVAATIGDLAEVCGGDRPVAVARELTKVHEEVWRGTLAGAVARSGERAWRGEVVVVVAGAPIVGAPEVSDGDLTAALIERLDGGERTRGAVDDIAAVFGVPRRRVYQLALAARGPGEAEGPPESEGPPQGREAAASPE
jgi:16S rRNA (cytidine1402-2'-O)-methyltransferase